MEKRRLDRLNEYYGFTLIELLITLAISSIILTAIYNLFISQNKLYIKEQEIVSMEQNLRAAIDLLSYNIRQANYIYNSSNNTMIKFTIPNNSTSNNTKQYSIDSTNTLRNFGNQPVAKKLTNLRLLYCSNNCNTNYTNGNNINRIILSLEACSDKGNLNISNLSMNKTIYCRNLCLEN